MFGIGMTELLLILVVALIFIGPKKLPELAKSLGKGFAEFKRATQDFKESVDIDNDFTKAKNTFEDMGDHISGALTDAADVPAQPKEKSEQKKPDAEKNPADKASEPDPENLKNKDH